MKPMDFLLEISCVTFFEDTLNYDMLTKNIGNILTKYMTEEIAIIQKYTTPWHFWNLLFVYLHILNYYKLASLILEQVTNK